MKRKRETFSLVFILPEGETLKDGENQELVEWLGVTVALSREQGIDCDLFVEGERVQVEVDVVKIPKGTNVLPRGNA